MWKIAIAGPSSQEHPDYDDPCDHLPLDEFEARGCNVDVIPWSSSDIQWGAYDLVLPLRAWFYHEDVDGFKRWLKELEESGTCLANSREVILWNLHKGYLLELKSEDISIPDTIILNKAQSAPDLAELMARRKWEKMFVKPAVGGGGWHVHRILSFSEARSFQEVFRKLLRKMDMMVQEAVCSGEEGEWSLVYIAGKYVQSVQKVPDEGIYTFGPGDTYRLSRRSAPKNVRQMADFTVKRLPCIPLYARIDIVEDKSSKPVLMEVECIEPSLYLDRASSIPFVDEAVALLKTLQGKLEH